MSRVHRAALRRIRAKTGAPSAEVTVPQHHQPGERPRPTSGGEFYLRGVLVVGWLFVLRLSASGVLPPRRPTQAQEAFLDGHVRPSNGSAVSPAALSATKLEARSRAGAARPGPHRV